MSSYPACPRRITANYCIHSNEMSVIVSFEKHNIITREKKKLYSSNKDFHLRRPLLWLHNKLPLSRRNEMFRKLIGVKWPLGNMLKNI